MHLRPLTQSCSVSDSSSVLKRYDPYGYLDWTRRRGIAFIAYSVLGGVEGDFGRITTSAPVVGAAAAHTYGFRTTAATIALLHVVSPKIGAFLTRYHHGEDSRPLKWTESQPLFRLQAAHPTGEIAVSKYLLTYLDG